MSANDSAVYQHNIKEDSIGLLDNIYTSNAAESVELLQAYQTDILPVRVAVAIAVKAAAAAATAGIVSPQQGPQTAAPFPQQPQAPTFPTQPPPQQNQSFPSNGQPAGHVCGCGKPMKFVPGGISKKTGNPYPGFYSCAEGKPPYGCGQTVNS